MNKAGSAQWPIRPIIILVIIIAVLMVSANGVHAQGVSFKQVAFEGDAAAEGVEFVSFPSAAINNDNTVAFVGSTTGQVASCSSGVNYWKSVADVIQAPVCVNTLFSRNTLLNANGDLAFVQAAGIFSESGGLHNVVSQTIPVPGLPDEKFDYLSRPGMNDSGEIVVYASTDITNTQGLWSETGGAGTLASLVLDGDPAPGLPPGTVFQALQNQQGAISNNGDVVFLATTDDPPPTGKQAQPGVWSVKRDGTVRKVIAQKDPAPGSTGNFSSTGFKRPGINAKGEVALVGTTSNLSEAGVWAERLDEDSQQYVLHNVFLKGTEIQVSETDFWAPFEFHSPAINSNGDVGFVACTQFSTIRVCGIVRATWNGSGYDHEAIALHWRIPGAARDPKGAGLGITRTQTFNMNAQGLFVFQAQTDTHGAAWGLWGWRPDIGLRRVYLATTPFRLPSGETRVIRNDTTKLAILVPTGGEDGRPKILNDAGMVVFTIDFEPLAPDTARREGLFVGNLNETLFLDSLEWRWRLR